MGGKQGLRKIIAKGGGGEIRPVRAVLHGDSSSGLVAGSLLLQGKWVRHALPLVNDDYGRKLPSAATGHGRSWSS